MGPNGVFKYIWYLDLFGISIQWKWLENGLEMAFKNL